MNDWLIIIGMGLITHALRLVMILSSGRLVINASLRRALRFAPAAVLAAIILPEMLQPAGMPDVSPGNDRLLAGLVAMAVAWRTQNMIWTVAVGMVLLWILQAIDWTILNEWSNLSLWPIG
jgi:branched-subunit amino acid transport protein